ncbi:MAG: F0F1 ATP synthase subunit epsilon [Clostridiales bacterium]|nr:F0F1 ATP synthase subunit epsilon [Clostridiales bacterium]
MASKFHLEIVTPDRVFYDNDAEMVIARTTEGDVGILAGHIPLVAPLEISTLKIKENGEEKYAAISGGFIKVAESGTTIIVDAAEWPEEIDIERAEEAKRRAEARLASRSADVDTLRAEIALKRAINRIRVANGK